MLTEALVTRKYILYSKNIPWAPVDNCTPLSPPYTSVIPTLFLSIKFLYTKTGIKKTTFKFPEKKNIASEVITFVLLGEVNFSKPTGYVMNQQFNIQQLYALPTLYLWILYLSENKQRLVPLTA